MQHTHNNRHIYYHNNPHNSEFMNIFGRLTGMKATAVDLDYFTDLLEIKHILESIITITQWKKTNADACLILCSINFSKKHFIKRIVCILVLTYIC